jgi:hypothetical protein
MKNSPLPADATLGVCGPLAQAKTHALPVRQISYQLWTINYPPSSRRRGTTADRSVLPTTTGAVPEWAEASVSVNTFPYTG